MQRLELELGEAQRGCVLGRHVTQQRRAPHPELPQAGEELAQA